MIETGHCAGAEVQVKGAAAEVQARRVHVQCRYGGAADVLKSCRKNHGMREDARNFQKLRGNARRCARMREDARNARKCEKVCEKCDKKSARICAMMRGMREMREMFARACENMREDARTCEEFH